MTGHRTIEAANRDIARASYVTAVVMFIFAAGLGAYINAKEPFRLAENRWLLFVPAGIAALGMIYLVRGFVNALRAGKAGKSFLDIEQAKYGSGVRGLIRTERRLEPRGDYTLHLACIERLHIAGTSKEDRGVDSLQVRWETTQTVPAAGVNSAVGIPVDLKVESFSWPEAPEESRGIHWELTIKAPVGGLGYSAVFGIPMEGQPRAQPSRSSRDDRAHH